MVFLTGAAHDMSYYILTVSKYVLPFLAVWVLMRCVRSMLREKNEPETWGYLVDLNGESHPVNHCECIVGRAQSADIVVPNEAVSRVHATLQRDDDGQWSVTDIRSKAGTRVNGRRITDKTPIRDGSRLYFAGQKYYFKDLDEEERERLEARRTPAGRFIGPGLTLLILTLFQGFLTLELSVNVSDEHVNIVCLAFIAVMILEWLCYLIMRSIRRSGFEPETLAFFLVTLGVEVTATSAPGEMLKELILVIAGIVCFFILGWWLRDMRRVKALRGAAAIAAVGLLCLNLLTSEEVFGAKNWLYVGGISVQPSEFVKVAYIYTGAASLDRLFARRNLIVFIGFSAICVCALALMGDFGAAVIFFATFLVISFMRSGSFATVFLAVGGAGIAGALVLSVKPYIAQRFASWGHVWDDIWGAGYQQTHALSAAASGGFFGKGAAAGTFKNVVAADTDLVFGVLSEELGLIIAVCAMFAVIALALFAVRNAAHGRNTYFVIAGCAAVSMMMVQMGLNVFGSLDILPFTGVTFPFVSRGGSSLISCWMLLAFVKATDTRRDASFVVKRAADAGDLEEEDDE